MEKKADRYDNKSIRFYDKGDHYELWFMDDFVVPGSGKLWSDGGEYTLLCDIAEELLNGDASKELHVLIWSYGGMVDALSTLLQGIGRYRRKVAVNLGNVSSCGWYLFFSCDERYTSKHCEFVYHGASMFIYGKTEEVANNVEHNRKRDAAFHENENITKYLTEDELFLSETSEVYLTGAELIKRGACKDYSLYRKRISPKLIKNEFFSFNNKVYRFSNGMMHEYKESKDSVRPDHALIEYEKDDLSENDLNSCNRVLNRLLKETAGTSPIPKQDVEKLLILINKHRRNL